MSFGVVRFRRLLFVSCASYAVTNLMDLTDTTIAGQLLGEVALGAIGLFWPVVELLCFVSTALAGGTAIRYSRSVASFDQARADRLFSGGLLAAAVLGMGIAAALFFFREACFVFFGAGSETLELLRPYWTWFVLNAALVPASTYLSTMICADGDGKTCTIAFSAELVVNIVSSYFLCRDFGTAGCALGTVAGTLASLLILPIHFFRPGNSLRFRPAFSLRDALTAIAVDFPESGYLLFTGVMYVLMNKVVVSRFGDEALPIVSAVIAANGLMYFFYGVSKAAQPIVAVYLGERNSPAVRCVMRDAVRWSVGLGLALALSVFAFPELPVRLVGIRSPAVFPGACLAVRIVSLSFVFFSVSSLFTSYWLFIGRSWVSVVLVVLQEFVYPAVGCLVGVAMGGLMGFWTGYALAAPLALTTIFGALVLKYGRARFPFLLERSRDAKIFSWEIAALDDGEACRIAREVQETLVRETVDKRYQVRAAMIVEDTLVGIRERNHSRSVDAEVVIDLNEGVRLCFRDGGAAKVGLDDSPWDDGFRSLMLERLRSAGVNHVLVTTGYNRRVIEL